MLRELFDRSLFLGLNFCAFLVSKGTLQINDNVFQLDQEYSITQLNSAYQRCFCYIVNQTVI